MRDMHVLDLVGWSSCLRKRMTRRWVELEVVRGLCREERSVSYRRCRAGNGCLNVHIEASLPGVDYVQTKYQKK